MKKLSKQKILEILDHADGEYPWIFPCCHILHIQSYAKMLSYKHPVHTSLELLASELQRINSNHMEFLFDLELELNSFREKELTAKKVEENLMRVHWFNLISKHEEIIKDHIEKLTPEHFFYDSLSQGLEYIHQYRSIMGRIYKYINKQLKEIEEK